MAKILRTLLLVLVGLAAAGLATQNNQVLSLRFLVWESMPLPVWVFLLAALAVGIIVGGATLLVDYFRLHAALRRERRRGDEEAARAEEEARRAEGERRRAEEQTARAEGEARRAEMERRRADDLAREADALRARVSALEADRRADLEVLEPDESTTAARPTPARGDEFE